MRPPAKAARGARPAAEAQPARRPGPLATALAAWLLPGAGHFLQGQVGRAIVFCVALLSMFALGLAFGGRLFPMQRADILVLLAAVAEWGLAVPRAGAALAGAGAGDVVAATYEFGNTFLITSGLLNALVILDAVDLAGRRGGEAA
jgi:hypothetical protein